MTALRAESMPVHDCLCVKVAKDGRLVRRVSMSQPYFQDQHNKQLFRFYIDETGEYFISFELDPKSAYNDYLKTTELYRAKPAITIERLGEDEVSPLYLHHMRQMNASRVLQPTIGGGESPSAPSGSKQMESRTFPCFRTFPDDRDEEEEEFAETYRYRVKETGKIFETDTMDIFESYRRWHDNLVTYVVDCGCEDSD